MAMRSSFLRTAFRGAVFQGGTGCVQVGFGGVRGGTIAFVSHEHPPHFSTPHWFSGPEMKCWGKESCNQSCRGVIVGCNYIVDANSSILKDSACLFFSRSFC